MNKLISAIFQGGLVKRFHTRNTLTIQNNAEHSFGVASIIAIIKPDCSKNLLLHALWHDIWEAETGDIPSYTKWRWPKMKTLLNTMEKELNKQIPIIPKITKEEYAILKMADHLETLLFCEKEQSMGNTCLDKIVSNCVMKICEINKKFPNKEIMSILFDKGLYK